MDVQPEQIAVATEKIKYDYHTNDLSKMQERLLDQLSRRSCKYDITNSVFSG